jgi:hypothetical protein
MKPDPERQVAMTENMGKIKWTEVVWAELDGSGGSIEIVISPDGAYSVYESNHFREVKGQAASVEAAKVACAGAMSPLLDWCHEWNALLEGSQLIVWQLPSEDEHREDCESCWKTTFVWHCNLGTASHASGGGESLEAAQEAAVKEAKRQKLQRT